MAFVQTFDNNYGVRVLQFYSLWPRPDIQFARVFAHPWLHRESNWSLWTFPAHVSICKKCCGRSYFPFFKQCYTLWPKPRQCVGQQLTLHWHQCSSTTKCLCQMSCNLQINWLVRVGQHYCKQPPSFMPRPWTLRMVQSPTWLQRFYRKENWIVQQWKTSRQLIPGHWGWYFSVLSMLT